MLFSRNNNPALQAVNDVSAGDAVLLDVRQDEEWNQGHAEPAMHIPLNEVLSGGFRQLPADKPVYVHCASGQRAGQACRVLSQNGYRAINIGGLKDWEKAGGKVV